ncbi:MAG: FAD-dependent monooxygenase [Pseudomonadota bacterium]
MVNQTQKHGKVAIIGGSMAGLFAAIALRANGWDAEVFERSEHELANRGAGIATHDELYNAFRRAGVELRDEMGVRSTGRVIFDRKGEVIGAIDAHQIMSSWGLIYRFLRQQFPDEHYHNGAALVGIQNRGERVVAEFKDRDPVEADWIIGADGNYSTVRSIVAPDKTLDYCGYFAWRGLFDETRIPSATHALVEERMALDMVPGGHWLGYLVAGKDDALKPGERWYNWAWYRTADAEQLQDMLTDSSGRHYPNGIPHPQIRETHIEGLREQAGELLAPQMQDIVQATPKPFFQGIYDVGTSRFVHDRVILIGDAAVTARPHVGIGVSKAADDAATLGAALADQHSLATWEQQRVAFGQAVLQWGRDLGSYIGPPQTTEEGREKALHYQKPETLIRLTAAIDPGKHLAAYL